MERAKYTIKEAVQPIQELDFKYIKKRMQNNDIPEIINEGSRCIMIKLHFL